MCEVSASNLQMLDTGGQSQRVDDWSHDGVVRPAVDNKTCLEPRVQCYRYSLWNETNPEDINYR